MGVFVDLAMQINVFVICGAKLILLFQILNNMSFLLFTGLLWLFLFLKIMKIHYLLLALSGFFNPLQSQPHGHTDLISDLPFDNLNVLDDELSSYQVFFTGENHYYTSQNTNIQLKMLEYLNKKGGVRNLILELGYSRGYMLNKYINDDSSYYDLMKYTTSSYFLEMYKELRKLNQELVPENRITVHGVDVERFADDGPILLTKLLPGNKTVPASIGFSVDVIRSYGAYCTKRYKSMADLDEKEKKRESYYYFPQDEGFYDGKTIDTMVMDYLANKAVFQSYLGEGFALFDRVFTSMIEYRKYMGYANMPQQYVYRERKMYDILSALILQHPDEKYYGQFGRCHISQTQLNSECDWWDFSSVAKRLNEGSAQDKVLSIGIFYNEKKMNKYFTLEHYFDDAHTSEELKKYLDIPCSNSNKVFRVDRKDTGLVKHYQYIIYNNSCESKKTKSMYGDNRVDDFHNSAFMLDFGRGMAQYDFSSLNTAIASNAKGLDELITFNSIGWSYNNEGFYGQVNYRWLKSVKAQEPSIAYSLGGYSLTESLGYMPHISRRFTFGVYASFGINKLSLNIRNDSATLPISPGFSKVDQLKYVNSGFVLGGGLDLRFALTRWLGVYARGNYLFDVSKKYWKQSVGHHNIMDRNSPKTSVGYYGLNLGLSLLIRD
jgi:hypothetical protein